LKGSGSLKDRFDRYGLRALLIGGDADSGHFFGFPSGANISSIFKSNNPAILKASGRLGSYFPVSMAFTV
jgi:hypothetical protein